MQRTKAPFRADEVGSLLRRRRSRKRAPGWRRARFPPTICARSRTWKSRRSCTSRPRRAQARDRWRIPPLLVAFRFPGQAHGLRIVSPRRGHPVRGRPDPSRRGAGDRQARLSRRSPMLDHFKFLKKHADVAHVMPKMTIPSPAVLHFRGGRKSISKEVYPDLEAFYEDLAKTYRKAVKAFYDAGCRYLQFDDTVWAYLCSQDELRKARERGDNPDGLQENLRARHQLRDRRPARQHDHHHPCLPRQFPLDLDFVRRLRAGGRNHARRHQLRRLFPGI